MPYLTMIYDIFALGHATAAEVEAARVATIPSQTEAVDELVDAGILKPTSDPLTGEVRYRVVGLGTPLVDFATLAGEDADDWVPSS